jgi:lipoprotein-anchoring transpeptidase ErfK/SrfK
MTKTENFNAREISMGNKSAGKHAAAKVADTAKTLQAQSQGDAAKFGGVVAAGSGSAATNKTRSRRAAAIAAGIVVGVLLVVYLIGAFVFSGHFFPNTYVGSTNYGMKTSGEMALALDDAVGTYNLQVTGQGLDFIVTSADAQVNADCADVSDQILTAQNPWAWPVSVFGRRDCSDLFTSTVTTTTVAQVVQAQVDAFNEQATMPTDASVQYVEANDDFEIISEVWGTALDANIVIEQVTDAILQLQSAVVLTDDAVLSPAVFKDDARLADALGAAQALTAANFDVTLAGTTVGQITSKDVASWVTIGEDFAVDLNSDSVSAWAQSVASKCTTVGAKRTYTREDGKSVTVSGGSYGWQVDSAALATALVEAIKAGQTDALAAPTTQAGTSYGTSGGRDWGARYVDVDLSEQHATFYGDDGSVIWESDIVSGNPNKGYDTPQGVWAVTRKSSPETLIGAMQSDGTPEYETEVQYWMPFKGNSVGFHDASWQSAFGGSRYLTNGSHGCINLPVSAASQLYSILKVGDVVVVHA